MPATADAYYVPSGEDTFLPTTHTLGPWSPDAQHFGPPTALLARAMARCAPRPGGALTKLTVDILGPLPPVEVRAAATVLRPGRTVELLGAELSVGGRVAARATAWRFASSDTAEVAGGAPEPMPPPTAGVERPLPSGWFTQGYLASVEWRWLAGSWDEPGPAEVWGRPRFPLVRGEKNDGLEPLLTVTDSASGLSARLNPAEGWLFPNTDLTVHIHRPPVGEWAGLRARTVIGPAGTGVATAVLHDLNGPVGHSSQILTVRAR
ncbi:MAG TPA: thioesterase family protein [Pseudonocardiaceae bacterium]